MLEGSGVSSRVFGELFQAGIGAATAAAGIPAHLIQTLGWWSSSAYMLYCTFTHPRTRLRGWRLCCKGLESVLRAGSNGNLFCNPLVLAAWRQLEVPLVGLDLRGSYRLGRQDLGGPVRLL